MNIIMASIDPAQTGAVEVSFEYVMAGLFALVIAGGIFGAIWLKRHPDV